MALFTCVDCADRKIGCHGKCEKYKNEKTKWNNMKDSVRVEIDSYKASQSAISKSKYSKRRKVQSTYGGKNYHRY